MDPVELEGPKNVYGVPVEGSGRAYVRFANGLHGLLTTGGAAGGGCDNRIIGTEGVIEVNVCKGPDLRIIRSSAEGWEAPNHTAVVLPLGDTVLSVPDAIDCLDSDRRPTLSSYHELQATVLIFAPYESPRIGGRVDLPLLSDDSALLARLNGPEEPLR